MEGLDLFYLSEFKKKHLFSWNRFSTSVHLSRWWIRQWLSFPQPLCTFPDTTVAFPCILMHSLDNVLQGDQSGVESEGWITTCRGGNSTLWLLVSVLEEWCLLHRWAFVAFACWATNIKYVPPRMFHLKRSYHLNNLIIGDIFSCFRCVVEYETITVA